MEFHHISVMPQEAVEGIFTHEDGIYVDCTMGGAGHSRRIGKRLSDRGRLICIDQDRAAIRAGRERLADLSCRVDIVERNFSHLDEILRELGVEKVDGILFDLGVSSHQIDTAERGFSYMQDAPLDMRMNPNAKLSAWNVVNEYAVEELARIFYEYGEERWGKRIAEFIVEARRNSPVETTGMLVEIVQKAIPKAVRKAAGGHPAKRIFQAIRIEVNDELGILEKSFRRAVQHLKSGGRIGVITFHSLEDRIVKRVFQEMARGCICPPKLPVCICGHRPEIRLCGKARQAQEAEVAENSRAKSAKLRIAEKI